MNKTVLLACCDFLILATLSLNYNPKVSGSQVDSTELPVSNDFQVIDSEADDSESLVISSFYEEKLSELKEQNVDFQKDLMAKESEFEKLNKDYLALQSKYQQLASKQQSNKSLHGKISESRIEVTVNMKEDDSFSPDLFRLRHYTSAVFKDGRIYLIAHRKKLGLEWPELINDGDILEYKMILANPGVNPWSFINSSSINSLNELPEICVVKIPAKYQQQALPILDRKPLSYLNDLYALKTDGRIIKIEQATNLPKDNSIIEISEKRFLGEPDGLALGDLISTSSGKILGMVTSSKVEGNTIRYKVSLLAEFDFNNVFRIPVTKSRAEKYFKSFVDAAKELYSK